MQDEQAKPWQAVLYDVQINSEIKNLIEMTKQEQQEFLKQWMNENLSRGFKNDELMTRSLYIPTR
ncbi:hypothetical protein AAHB62_09395 [Bacillus cereus]